VADMPFPYYRLQANGPNETGFTLLCQIEEGGGGPLPGQTMQGVLDGLKQQIVGTSGDVTASLTHYEITTTTDL